MEQTFPMITADYYPTIPRERLIAESTYKINLNDLSSLGPGFVVAADAITNALKRQPNMQGVYRCVFPEGVTGKLAAFRDGSGFTGNIMNNGSLQAQARWVPVEGESVAMGIDPVTIAVAVALTAINKKLDLIVQTNQDILRFLQQDKESELEGAVNSLSDILANYRFNSDNAIWIGSQLTVVSTIKGKAEHNIIFYRKGLTTELEKQEVLHGAQKASKRKDAVQQKLKYYQLCVYLYAYSSFLEVLLGGRFAKDYLDRVSEKLQEYALQYRVDYTECYNHLEAYKKSSIESKALEWGGAAGKKVGGMIARIPVISKGPVDEALITAGERLEGIGGRKNESYLAGLDKNRDAGIQLFAENVERLNALANKPVELLFDNENVYFCA